MEAQAFIDPHADAFLSISSTHNADCPPPPRLRHQGLLRPHYPIHPGPHLRRSPCPPQANFDTTHDGGQFSRLLHFLCGLKFDSGPIYAEFNLQENHRRAREAQEAPPKVLQAEERPPAYKEGGYWSRVTSCTSLARTDGMASAPGNSGVAVTSTTICSGGGVGGSADGGVSVHKSSAT